MRKIAKMVFDKDAPLSFLFYPLYYMAEIIFVGFQASGFTLRKKKGVQTLETEVGLSAELVTSTKGRNDALRPDKIKAMTFFWQDDALVRFVGLSIAYNRLVKLVGALQDATFLETLERVAPLQKKKVVVKGASAVEIVAGGDENDVIKTRGGDDSIAASRGRDKIDGGGGDDAYVAGFDDSRLKADLAKGVVRKAGAGRDKIKSIEDVVGSSKNDVIRGDGGDNQLSGAGGRDKILGRGGDDTLFGGDGPDRIFGGGGEDRLFGDEGADRLYGGDAADLLYGGAGDDTLDGGAGTDVLTGGEGADEFIIDPSDAGGPDSVADYDHAEGDRLRLPGAAEDYALLVVGDDVLVRRVEGGAVIAVLPGDAGTAVLDDAFYGL